MAVPSLFSDIPASSPQGPGLFDDVPIKQNDLFGDLPSARNPNDQAIQSSQSRIQALRSVIGKADNPQPYQYALAKEQANLARLQGKPQVVPSAPSIVGSMFPAVDAALGVLPKAQANISRMNLAPDVRQSLTTGQPSSLTENEYRQSQGIAPVQPVGTDALSQIGQGISDQSAATLRAPLIVSQGAKAAADKLAPIGQQLDENVVQRAHDIGNRLSMALLGTPLGANGSTIPSGSGGDTVAGVAQKVSDIGTSALKTASSFVNPADIGAFVGSTVAEPSSTVQGVVTTARKALPGFIPGSLPSDSFEDYMNSLFQSGAIALGAYHGITKGFDALKSAKDSGALTDAQVHDAIPSLVAQHIPELSQDSNVSSNSESSIPVAAQAAEPPTAPVAFVTPESTTPASTSTEAPIDGKTTPVSPTPAVRVSVEAEPVETPVAPVDPASQIPLDPTGATGLARQFVDPERVARGDDPLPQKGVTVQQIADWGEKLIGEGKVNPQEVAESGRIPTNEEAAALVHYKRVLANQSNEIIERINDGVDPVTAMHLGKTQDWLANQIDLVDKAGVKFGSHWHEGGMILQTAFTPNYSITSLRARAKAANLGEELSPDIQKIVDAQGTKIKGLQDLVDAHESQRQALEDQVASLKAERQANLSRRQAGRSQAKGQLKAERADIVTQMKSLLKNAAVPESISAGIDITKGTDLAKLFVKLVKNVGSDVGIRFSDLADTVNSHLKEAGIAEQSKRTIHDVLTGDYDPPAAKTLSEAQSKLIENRRLADLSNRIEDAVNGVSRESNPKQLMSPEVDAMRKELSDIQKRQNPLTPKDPSVALSKKLSDLLDVLETGPKEKPVKPTTPDTPVIADLKAKIKAAQDQIKAKYPAGPKSRSDQLQIDAINKKVTDLQGQLDGAYRHVKGPQVVDSASVAEAKGKLADVRTLIDKTDQVHELERQIRDNDFPSKPAPKTLSHQEAELNTKLKSLQDERASLKSDSRSEAVKKNAKRISDLNRQIQDVQTDLTTGRRVTQEVKPEAEGPPTAQIDSQQKTIDAARQRLKELKSERSMTDSNEELKRQIRENDFPQPKEKVKGSPQYEEAKAKLQGEKLKTEQIIRQIKSDKMFQQKGILAKVGHTFWQTLNGVTRNINLLGHASAPFVQGRDVIFADPKAWLKSWPEMAKGYRGGDTYMHEQVGRFMTENNGKYWQEAQKTDLPKVLAKSHGSLTDVEGNFLTSRDLSQKVPGMNMLVSHSGAAFNGFLNEARWQMFKHMVDAAPTEPKARTEFLKAMANDIGIMTGRSTSDLAMRAAKGSEYLFSPRYTISKAEHLAGKSFWNAADSPQARIEIAKRYARTVAGYASIAYLAQKLFGGEVELDPRSSDFGHWKVGNMDIGIFDADTEMARLVYRTLIGSKSEDGKITGPSFDPAMSFASDKLTPFARLPFTVTQGQYLPENQPGAKQSMGAFGEGARAFNTSKPGEPEKPAFDWLREAAEQGEPITFKSIKEAHDGGVNIPASVLNLFGISVRPKVAK